MFLSIETAKNLTENEKEDLLSYFPPSVQAEVLEKINLLTETLVTAGYNIGFNDCLHGVKKDV